MFKIALTAAALAAVLSSNVQAQTARPSIVLTGLSSAQVAHAIRVSAQTACRQAYRGYDPTDVLDAAGYDICVTRTVADAQAAVAKAIQSGSDQVTKVTFAPEPEQH